MPLTLRLRILSLMWSIGRQMKKLILILFLSAVSLSAQSPEHRFFDRNNLIGFSAMFATRALDVHSTCRFLRRGYREAVFPSQNCRTIAVTAFGLSGAGMGGIYWLHRRGHHKLERWLPRIAAISGGVAATWNYSIQ